VVKDHEELILEENIPNPNPDLPRTDSVNEFIRMEMGSKTKDRRKRNELIKLQQFEKGKKAVLPVVPEEQPNHVTSTKPRSPSSPPPVTDIEVPSLSITYEVMPETKTQDKKKKPESEKYKELMALQKVKMPPRSSAPKRKSAPITKEEKEILARMIPMRIDA